MSIYLYHQIQEINIKQIPVLPEELLVQRWVAGVERLVVGGRGERVISSPQRRDLNYSYFKSEP